MYTKDYELDRLKAEMDNAQKEIDKYASDLDYIKSIKDSIKNQISDCKYRISDIKHSIDAEYEAMHICYQAKDYCGIDVHKYNASCYNDALRREHEILDGYFNALNRHKSEYESLLYSLRDAKTRKHNAIEAFHSRLEMLKTSH